MVLLLDGFQFHQAPQSSEELYQISPRLHKGAKKLASRPPVNVGPDGVKYVRQKGYAVSFPGESTSDGGRVLSLGTEDVLTCHVIILRYDRVTGLGHFDEYVTPSILDSMLRRFEDKVRNYLHNEYQDYWDEEDWEWEEWEENQSDEESVQSIDFRETPISLGMVGGYSDEAGKAGRLGRRLFSYFHEHPYRFQIQDICLGDVNTRNGMYRKEPIIGGVSLELKTGRLHKANFSSRAFLSGMSDDMVNQLLLGPSLIKKPNALKRIILEKEDQGYSI